MKPTAGRDGERDVAQHQCADTARQRERHAAEHEHGVGGGTEPKNSSSEMSSSAIGTTMAAAARRNKLLELAAPPIQ